MNFTKHARHGTNCRPLPSSAIFQSWVILLINKPGSLVGVAPMNRESGRYKGKRKIQGGRAQVRTVLYMAMMSAMQCNPVI